MLRLNEGVLMPIQKLMTFAGEELTSEMYTQYHSNPVDQAANEADPEQFETSYRWFLA